MKKVDDALKYLQTAIELLMFQNQYICLQIST